jgi:hypothetical protein
MNRAENRSMVVPAPLAHQFARDLLMFDSNVAAFFVFMDEDPLCVP